MLHFAKLISKYFAIIIIIAMLLGFAGPETFGWVARGRVFGQPLVSLLLGIIMFGMGMTLSLKDFKLVAKRPLDVLIGAVAQFGIMPLLGIGLAMIFGLEEGLLVGMALVGASPGGTSSNVITYMADGDVAFSVTMTTVSTLLAPFLTPLITFWLIRHVVEFSLLNMFISIFQIVLLPIILGVGIKAFFKERTKIVEAYMPAIATLAIAAIVAGVVGVNADRILASLGVIILAVVLHNLLGYALGYALGHYTKMGRRKSLTLAIEVGMQNSGLATTLAITAFAAMPLAAVPGALFSVWHNVSGAILAGWAKNRKFCLPSNTATKTVN